MTSPSLITRVGTMDRVDMLMAAVDDGPLDVMRIGYAWSAPWAWDKDCTSPSRPITAIAYRPGTPVSDVLATAAVELRLEGDDMPWQVTCASGSLHESMPRGTRLRAERSDGVTLAAKVMDTGARESHHDRPIVLHTWSMFPLG